MKKFTELYRPYMKRPIVYKTFARFVIALVPALIWERFLKADASLSVAEYAFFVVGFFLLAMAWFNYLNLDGVRIHHLNEKPDRTRKKKHQQRDIVDFANEKIISFDELDYDERVLCTLISNLISGAAFIAVSLIAPLFG